MISTVRLSNVALALCGLSTLLRTTLAAGDVAATVPEVRATIDRGLPFIAKIGSDWMDSHNCNSCHVVAFQVWSHKAAAARGFAVDANKLAEWTDWALADAHSDRYWFRLRPHDFEALRAAGVAEEILAKLKPLGAQNYLSEKLFLEALEKALGPEDFEKYKAQLVKRAALPNNGGGPDTLAQLLLGRNTAGEDKTTAASYEAVRKLLLEWQLPGGSWKADGQLPALRWDGEDEMNNATTMWSLLAINASPSTDETLARSRARALEYLRTTKPGKTLQTLALRAIVAHDFDEPSEAEQWRKELLSRQNADGGWSWWKENHESDAFATGQALYALGRIGRAGSDPAVNKAWHFLTSTQGEDGGWKVPQQAINTRERKLNVYSFWGAAWATIGMLETLPLETTAP
jgi:Squalene-hopene cyclase N-terminal domain